MKYVFGPVPSRRLGSSLGVDLVPYKTCSLDCIYCQLGRTTEKTTARKIHSPADEVISEVTKFLEINPKCDFITISGSGEPTLNRGIGRIISGIKKVTDIPVAVLTNAFNINDFQVQEELSTADLIIPSLDAADQGIFERINRPAGGIRITDMIRGLINFSQSHTTEIWLEIMLAEGINDSPEHLQSLKRAIDQIKPNKVQLNTVIRPPAESYAKPVSPSRLSQIAEELGAEVIADFKREVKKSYSGDKKELIYNLLRRRPCTMTQISGSLGMHVNEVIKYVEVLLETEKKMALIHKGDKKYYFIKD